MNRISVLDVANYFLSKNSMTPKKLQKLAYYAEAWHQALLQRPLIEDESFQAWVHGPVAPSLYQKYKTYGWNPIPKTEEATVNFCEESLSILESVWETYGDQDGNSLEALTHSEAPWINARAGLEPNENSNVVISTEDMRNYYRSIYLGG
ncbi:Panacea domain-containing protein [Lentibacillus saliphilus]|uniref:Panacea domain-containing protein n=1 Tax=Lentibacillus saliphilus TaxID=2737028 RepID=UPI001C309443|nr:type II toxin-antitoxin system antitoxin SocA domain-containing protein [Lentibacillus saliphilus]